MKRDYDKLTKSFGQYSYELLCVLKKELEEFNNNLGIRTNKTPDNFEKISCFIEQKTRKQITNSGLRDFYNGKKDHGKIKTSFLGPILEAFDYHFNINTKQWEKKQYKENVFNSIFQNLKPNIDFSKSANEYIGKYKYFFFSGENPSYSDPYENEIDIFPDYSVKIYNPFKDEIYFGICIIRHNILQIISPDIDLKITGIGNVLNFTLNEYRKKAILFPGLRMSFSSENIPMASAALLSSNLEITKRTKIVKEYFKKCSQNVVNSPASPKDIAELIYEIGFN